MTTRFTTTNGLFRRATSLLEVVVATGIIATGVAITLPAVGTIRDSSEMLTCKDHLRTVGQGQLSYSLDHMNRFPGTYRLPGIHPRWLSISWIHILNEQYFGDPPIGGIDGNYRWIPVNTGTIRWVGNSEYDGYQHKTQIWCPSLRDTNVESQRCYLMNSYASATVNSSYQQEYGLMVYDMSHHSQGYILYGAKTSKFQNPAQSVLIQEAIYNLDWVTAGNDLPLILDPESTSGGASTTGLSSPYHPFTYHWHFRHNYRMNMLYMDTHVATETFAAEGLNTAERYKPTDMLGQ